MPIINNLPRGSVHKYIIVHKTNIIYSAGNGLYIELIPNADLPSGYTVVSISAINLVFNGGQPHFSAPMISTIGGNLYTRILSGTGNGTISSVDFVVGFVKTDQIS